MKTTISQPKLTVVGAGPGDPLLLTLKAIHAINEADVILYDALVNTEILKHARMEVPKIFVGKRKSKHSLSQEEINQLIISFAYTHGHVVRLKGGDPFVFGRGKEEINFAESFNIETSYVPGISSSIGVAGLAGIPVTHRGSSESFWVITGTTKSGELSADVFAAAKTNATVVILMGLSKISEIVAFYKLLGKDKVPVAIIQDGSTLRENHILGTIGSIEGKAERELSSGAGIIVIGEVVKQHRFFEIEEKEDGTGLSLKNSVEKFPLPVEKPLPLLYEHRAEEILDQKENGGGKRFFEPGYKFLLN